MLSVLHRTPWLASKFSLWPAAPPVPSLLSKHQVTFPVENYPPTIASLTSICLDPRGRAQSPSQPAPCLRTSGKDRPQSKKLSAASMATFHILRGHRWLGFRSSYFLYSTTLLWRSSVEDQAKQSHEAGKQQTAHRASTPRRQIRYRPGTLV